MDESALQAIVAEAQERADAEHAEAYGRLSKDARIHKYVIAGLERRICELELQNRSLVETLEQLSGQKPGTTAA